MKYSTLLTGLLVAGFVSTSIARKPNVVIIYTDDQSMSSFGFIEGKAHTPNIDRLAEKGAYFSRAYVSSSVCTPSRYTCLTGKYASRCEDPGFAEDISAEGQTKVLFNMRIAEDEWTFPKVLQKNGYKTGMVGKWHIGHGKHAGEYKTVPNNDPADPAVKAVLKHNYDIVCEGIASMGGFDYVGGAYSGNPNDDRNLKKIGCNVHAVEWQTKHALEFIEKYKDEPFALYFATTLLHVPDPAKDLERDPRLSPLGLLDEPIEGVLPSRKDVIKRAKKAGVEGKLIAATWLDDVVGAVQDKLKELKLEDDTLIIYFNDNNVDDQGKGSCYQGGTHVPMMVYLPGKVKAGERTELVGNIDIAATVLDVCGIEAPADMRLDGKSLVPLLQGKKVDWRDSLYLEIGLTRAVVSGDYKYLAFRVPESYTDVPLAERLAEHKESMESIYKNQTWTQNYWKIDPDAKYMHMGMGPGGKFLERLQLQNNPPFKNAYFDGDQLYNLKEDPRETTNLAGKSAHAEELKKMQGKLKKILSDVPGTFSDLKPE